MGALRSNLGDLGTPHFHLITSATVPVTQEQGLQAVRQGGYVMNASCHEGHSGVWQFDGNGLQKLDQRNKTKKTVAGSPFKLYHVKIEA